MKKCNAFCVAIMLVISSVAYSDITGTIYRDFDADGQQALLEPGLAGVLINAYDATGAVVGNSPQTSAFDGSYTLTGISSDVRVEFTLPIDGSLDFIKNGAIGTNNSTSVVFATDGQIIDYGFNNPSDFCESDPQLTSSCFVNGDPLPAMSPAGALDVLVTWPRSRVGNSTPPDHIAFGRELGSVWGLTWDNEREILFASAFLRRHAGMGPDGMGGIYQIDLSNMASPVISSFLAVPNVGLDPRVEDMVPLPTDPTAQSEDTTAFDSVGKRSLGDMDISDDNSTLYVMNLNTQSLISIDIDTAVITNTFPVTNPGCAAASDVRPFGVEFHDGEVYIGVVCSAESTNDTNDLDAYVLRLNAGVFVNHFGPINMDYPRTNAFNNAAGLIPWNPWSATFQTTATSGFDGSDVNSVYPQPVLSDIEFDSIDGSMILGFLDRQGVQTGAMNLTPDGTQTVQTIAAGDILRVCSNGMGGYVLENSGVCLGNGSGTNAGDGPGGGEYYDNEFFSNHKETSIGGLSHIPGTNEVVSTVMDPFAFRSGGVRIFNNFNGGLIDGFEVYEIDAVGTFGKAVGLGDVELMCGPPPMEIGNRVWCDNGSGVSANDGNGIQDPGEAGVSGVNLTLTCGTESADVLTDGSGHYLFTDPVWSASGNSLSSVIPRDSSCTVSIDMTVPANDTAVMSACGLITPTQLNATSALLNDEIRDSNGSTTMPSMIVAMVNTTGVNTTGGPGENDHTIDFGFGPTLQLGDFVWFDTNQDGIQDGGEPGVNGVTVNLYDNATCTAPIFMTTTTLNGGLPAADGYYNFGPLFPGSYCVEFSDLPAGHQFTVNDTPPDDAVDSDANPLNGQVANINLMADDFSIDAGIFLNGSISGVTWCESTTNANTSYDPGDSDTLLPNIQVTLYEDANCSDTVDGSDATTAVSMDTNASGAYLFSNLPVGPVGNALCYITEVDVNDTDLNACDTAITPETLGPDLDTSNPDNPNNDFGFEEILQLGDYVWFDTNQDGIQDGGEPGVNGVTVNLYDNATCTAPIFMTTTTLNGGLPAADGYYNFGPLFPGSYCVEFSDLPAGHQFTVNDTPPDDAVDSDANPLNGQVANINLMADDFSIDAGIFLNGSISGVTWCESTTNANTSYDPGDSDTLLPNIQVTLYEDANCSDTVDGSDATTAVSMDTNASGAYLFSNLPVGPVGNALCYITEVDVNDTDLNACDTAITPETLGPDLDTSNPDNPNNDFGFDDLLALGDYVWYDTNQDGIQDVGEPGVNGVTVNLYDNATCSAPIFSTTETLNGGLPAADGFYFFSDLDAGSYCVEFTDIPVNYQFTVQNTPNDALDSDADPLNGQVQNIDLTAVDPSIDAGIFLNGSISGVTWCESTTNANTSYDPGDSDTLLPNIQVTLYEDANCSDTVDGSDATTAVSMDTNASGAYLFSNLPVGPVGNALCYITEVDVNDTDLNACDTAITPETLGPDLDTSNPDNPNNDFGFDDLLALGDYVWYDNNQNGLQDAGEPGVNGVTVNLYDNATCTAPVLDSEITANGGVPATDGYYYFPDLDAGSYCVEFMDLPVDFVITDQNVSGDDSVDSDGDPVTGQVQNINLTAVDPTIDLGVYAPIGSVSGQIFCDDNPQNGVNDAGEEISGVLISLYRDMTCDGNGLQLIDSQNTGLAGDFLFGNLPVALSPAPPNPEVCYVMDFDSNDPALGECNIPITPDSETVMLDTDNPDAPPVEFGVIPPAEPIPVPLNSNLALLILLAILGGVGLYSRRRKLLS